MRIRNLIPALLLLVAAGCDSILDIAPTSEVSEDQAISDAVSARAAMAGAYDALQDNDYYGGDLLFFGDLSSDNAEHVGTFTTFADANRNELSADNSTIEGIWDALYIAIGRANTLIEKLPDVPDLPAAERAEMRGEAHFLRALHYHNLVRSWGGVPVRTAPAASVGEASQISRATLDQVYTQILDDLNQAASLLGSGTDVHRASLGAVEALRSRVLLYREDWAGAQAAADAVLAMGYELAPNYGDLFDEEGKYTAEDIFKLKFTTQESNVVAFYYLSRSVGGRREIAPTASLIGTYEAGDLRKDWSIAYDSRDRVYGSKFRAPGGTEDVHVIRLAEVILNRAEALAQQNELLAAVNAYNAVRARAGLIEHVLGIHVTDQASILAAIDRERRLELAFEGDRWPDMVRTERYRTYLPEPKWYQALYPIPQNEIDVAPNLTQNPGY